MSTFPDPDARVEAITDRSALAPLLAGIGLTPLDERLPRPTWAAYGLEDARGLRALWRVGHAGSLEALLLEVEADVELDAIARLAGRVRRRNPARLHLVLAADPGYRRVTLGTFGLDGGFRHLVLEPGRLRSSDRAALEEMAPRAGEVGLELAIRHAAALDRSRITGRFFRDYRTRRSAIAAAWTGIPDEATDERNQLALLLLSRMTFLYFLQRRGALAGDDLYLPRLFGRWSGTGDRSFYRARLAPLFFEVLNRRPEDRGVVAAELGPLPYLNGGLFEPHALERRHDGLDLPDREIRACLDDLFERYRFTVREAGEGAGHSVDPEVLGQVFEGLMVPDRRSETGSFYTPAPVVDRVVREAVATYVSGECSPSEARAVAEGAVSDLPIGTRHRARAALERVRILDPACGSGAFLVGALHRLATALGALSDTEPNAIRRRLVAGALHGVDLLDDAALLCALRLWLALVAEDRIRPLPNLDRRIRQGDALVDPFDLAAMAPDLAGLSWHPLRDPRLRHALRAIEPVARRYVESGPEDRDGIRVHLEQAERRLARRWLAGVRTAYGARLRALRARAQDRDLFGELADDALRARAAAPRIEERVRELEGLGVALEESGALPFFSFGVHFADAAPGFDLILSNPPWVRAHRWPERIRRVARRFEVCRPPAPDRTAALCGGTGAGAQVDLSLLFLERSVRLLAPGGVLAILLPAKALRALYGGAARRLVLRDLELALIEDHALDQRSIFRADAFAAVVIARKPREPRDATAQPNEVAPAGGARSRPASVRIRLVRRGVETLRFETAADRLPLFAGDPASPWLLAPPDVVEAIRTMQQAGPPIGEHRGLRPRRGIMTGANDVLLFTDVRPKLGDLAQVEAEGYELARREGRGRRDSGRYRALVELEGLRPLVRGAGIDAFHYRTTGYVVWCHDRTGTPMPAPPRLRRYLEGHRDRLEGRSGWRPGRPLGSVFRIGPHTFGPKVAWHDLSDTLRAVALPASVRCHGVDRELVPLNTVYFIPVEEPGDAVLLAGILNALPVRVLGRSIAERAKDARFRFFAWTVSAFPLPVRWQTSPASAAIRRISERAHRDGGIEPEGQVALDRAVADLYDLPERSMVVLRRFDRWLRGRGPEQP